MSPTVTVRVNDRWDLEVPEHRAAHWQTNPMWEQERLASMAANLRPGMVVYDVGAEQGDISALVAQWVRGCSDPTCPCQDGDSCHYLDEPGFPAMTRPDGWHRGGVVLVEPAPWYWPTIRATFDANGVVPLGAVCGFVADVDDIGGVGYAGSEPWPPEAYEPMTGREAFQSVVGATERRSTIDAMAAYGYPPPDAITMDIEGAEILAARGAQRTLAEHRPLVWVSVHAEAMFHDHGVYQAEFHSLFHRHGYEKRLLGFDHELHVFYWPAERDVVLP